MSKPSDKQKAVKPVQDKAVDYDKVLSGVVELLDAARRASARVVNSLMTATYWEIGRRIVEHEQAGKERAAYGAELLTRLSADLTKRFGRGFSVDNLERCGFPRPAPLRQFPQRRCGNLQAAKWPTNCARLRNDFPCRGRIIRGCCGCGRRMPLSFTTRKRCAEAGR